MAKPRNSGTTNSQLLEQIQKFEASFYPALVGDLQGLDTLCAAWSAFHGLVESSVDQQDETTLLYILSFTEMSIAVTTALEALENSPAQVLKELDRAVSNLAETDLPRLSIHEQNSERNSSPPYIEAASSWLLANLHNPYPSPEIRKCLSRDSGSSVKSIDAWFVDARRRIGWVNIRKKYFPKRSDMVKAATLVFNPSATNNCVDSHQPSFRDASTDIDVQFMAMQVRAEELFLGKAAQAPTPGSSTTLSSPSPSFCALSTPSSSHSPPSLKKRKKSMSVSDDDDDLARKRRRNVTSSDDYYSNQLSSPLPFLTPQREELLPIAATGARKRKRSQADTQIDEPRKRYHIANAEAEQTPRSIATDSPSRNIAELVQELFGTDDLFNVPEPVQLTTLTDTDIAVHCRAITRSSLFLESERGADVEHDTSLCASEPTALVQDLVNLSEAPSTTRLSYPDNPAPSSDPWLDLGMFDPNLLNFNVSPVGSGPLESWPLGNTESVLIDSTSFSSFENSAPINSLIDPTSNNGFFNMLPNSYNFSSLRPICV